MNLKKLPKIHLQEREMSQFQQNVATWVDNLVENFTNLTPSKVTITDDENNLNSSIVTITELEYLSGLTINIQQQFDEILSDITDLQNDKLDIPTTQTYTPVVTLVGGAGNTVPTYSTVIGRYTEIGSIVHVDVLLINTSGGTAGAGTGQVAISLPSTAANNNLDYLVPMGEFTNGGTRSMVLGIILGNTSNVLLGYQTTLTAFGSLDGNLQNNASRVIRLNFWYEQA